MEKKDYNGWYNYNVWNVMLYVDNERDIYEDWMKIGNSYYQNKISYKQFMRGVNSIGSRAKMRSDIKKEKLSKQEILEIRKGLREQYQDWAKYAKSQNSKTL